jgi:hypothetical protein
MTLRLVLVLTVLAGAGVLAQVGPKPDTTTGPGAASTWTTPRTAFGHPDLEGTWENNSATPLERPQALADKPFLTDAEVALMTRRQQERFSPEADAVFGDSVYLELLRDTPTSPRLGNTGTYSQNWLPDRYFERRTSLIVDPPSGRLPAMTPEATRARAAALATRQGRRAERAQDLTLTDRCVSYGVPDLFAAYMSVYRIVQTPDTVAIVMEKIHDARIVPLDGRVHVPRAIRNYLGDSRGRWEADTLVVETTNFHPGGNPMGGLLNRASHHLKLTERFRRVSSDVLEYTFTVDDPTVWVSPWTATITWKRASGDVLEYACHEGNYSLRGMLSALRAEEAAGR